MPGRFCPVKSAWSAAQGTEGENPGLQEHNRVAQDEADLINHVLARGELPSLASPRRTNILPSFARRMNPKGKNRRDWKRQCVRLQALIDS
jgi:hypothetical protein